MSRPSTAFAAPFARQIEVHKYFFTGTLLSGRGNISKKMELKCVMMGLNEQLPYDTVSTWSSGVYKLHK